MKVAYFHSEHVIHRRETSREVEREICYNVSLGNNFCKTTCKGIVEGFFFGRGSTIFSLRENMSVQNICERDFPISRKREGERERYIEKERDRRHCQ